MMSATMRERPRVLLKGTRYSVMAFVWCRMHMELNPESGWVDGRFVPDRR